MSLSMKSSLNRRRASSKLRGQNSRVSNPTTGGGCILGYFSQKKFESSRFQSRNSGNELFIDKLRSFILLDSVLDRKQADRECGRSCYVPLSLFFGQSNSPSSPLSQEDLSGLQTREEKDMERTRSGGRNENCGQNFRTTGVDKKWGNCCRMAVGENLKPGHS